LVAAGLWPRGRLALAWLGGAVLLVFAGLTVFSVGLVLLPAVGLLLVALIVLTALTLVPARQRSGRRCA
jgi:hypothetical protein